MEKNLLQNDMDDKDIMAVVVPYFCVTSTHCFDTDRFTSLIKIQPTSIWTQKIPKLLNVKGVPQAKWTYRFRYTHTEWIEKATDMILSLFYPLRGIIKPFIQQNRLRATVYLRLFATGEENYPLMELTRKSIRHINELGASFQIDIYPIDKIEPYEKLSRVSCKTTQKGRAYWELREM